MEEIWKPIEGFEERYEISNCGNVASLKYGGRDSWGLLVPKKNNKGYLWVELWKDKKRSCFLIHRLVAQAFLENENGYDIVNHKDENPLNNHVENLEWCTHLYNVRYSLKLHGKYRPRQKPKSVRGKYRKANDKRICQIAKTGEIVKIWENFGEIKRTINKNEYGIRECCYGKRKTAYGYGWQFA